MPTIYRGTLTVVTRSCALLHRSEPSLLRKTSRPNEHELELDIENEDVHEHKLG